jgi:hypothetical protein
MKIKLSNQPSLMNQASWSEELDLDPSDPLNAPHPAAQFSCRRLREDAPRLPSGIEWRILIQVPKSTLNQAEP